MKLLSCLSVCPSVYLSYCRVFSLLAWVTDSQWIFICLYIFSTYFSPIQTWWIRVLSLWLRFYFCFIFWTLVWFLLRVPDVWLKCTYLVNCRLSPHPHPITTPPPSHTMGSQVKVRVHAGYLGERSRVIANSNTCSHNFLTIFVHCSNTRCFPGHAHAPCTLEEGKKEGKGMDYLPKNRMRSICNFFLPESTFARCV